MALHNEIEKWRKEIRTDGYPMSIGEWISLYDKETPEIDIHPEFQRFYRWSHEQKSKLIESILLGIPIPPIFVSQRKDGVWDVVDGLQRLSTIYEFLGILRDEDNKKTPPLVLDKTQYLPSLEGKKWQDNKDKHNSLSEEERLLIKRSKISVSILLRESDATAKFELFQRLNTGGSKLTAQEVRNCMLIASSPETYRWIKKLSEYDNFQETIELSENPLEEQYDLELVLRFLVFHRIPLESLSELSDVGVFLTKQMFDLAKQNAKNKKLLEESFKATFDLLAATVGRNAFRRFDTNRKKFAGGFLLSPFEVIAFGIGYNSESLPNNKKVEPAIASIWSNTIYKEWSGSGVTATRRLPKLIPLGRKLFTK
jgi:uncharacterized protein with ParB-like and HNH nuclease domain